MFEMENCCGRFVVFVFFSTYTNHIAITEVGNEVANMKWFHSFQLRTHSSVNFYFRMFVYCQFHE